MTSLLDNCYSSTIQFASSRAITSIARESVAFRYIRNLDNGAIPDGKSEHLRTPRVSEDKALTGVPRR